MPWEVLGVGAKIYFLGEVHRSVEKGNFEGERARRMPSRAKRIRFVAGSFTSHAERLSEEEKHTLPFSCITSPTGARTTSWRHLK